MLVGSDLAPAVFAVQLVSELLDLSLDLSYRLVVAACGNAFTARCCVVAKVQLALLTLAFVASLRAVVVATFDPSRRDCAGLVGRCVLDLVDEFLVGRCIATGLRRRIRDRVELLFADLALLNVVGEVGVLVDCVGLLLLTSRRLLRPGATGGRLTLGVRGPTCPSASSGRESTIRQQQKCAERAVPQGARHRHPQPAFRGTAKRENHPTAASVECQLRP